MIKQLARDFYGYFECIGENTEKYITFSVPIKKVLDNDNDNNNNKNNNNDNDRDKDKNKNKVKTVTYRLKFSYRIMQGSLSNLVDNLSGIDNKKPEKKFVDTMKSMTYSLSQ